MIDWPVGALGWSLGGSKCASKSHYRGLNNFNFFVDHSLVGHLSVDIGMFICLVLSLTIVSSLVFLKEME